MSSISILGNGNMAAAFAQRALASGHSVEVIGRDPNKTKQFVSTLKGATIGTAPTGELVVIAVPYSSAASVVSQYASALHGKIVIDITNPAAGDFKSLVTPLDSSGSQEIAKAIPGVKVIKAFNTLFAHVLASRSMVDVFFVGDDAEAKARVSKFIESLGLRALDVGALAMARSLEHLALIELGVVANSIKHINFSFGVVPFVAQKGA